MKLYFNWSTGKDSALALYHLQQNKNFNVQHLLTSVNAHHNRVSMHGLRRELMQKQIESIGLSYSTIELPEEPDMAEYENIMRKTVEHLKAKGFNHTAFGDIFLEDLRVYREKQLLAYNITAHFPLWKRDTRTLMQEFIDLGFKAIVICTKSDLLDKSFCGRLLDQNFLNDLPNDVDPCGENGEFHTFCFDGPVFKHPVNFTKGDLVYREYPAPTKKEDSCYAPQQGKRMGFWFCDLY